MTENTENTVSATASATEELFEYVTPRCYLCSLTGTLMVLPSELKAYDNGATVQEAMSRLSVDDREQFITGTHTPCWTEMFGNDDENFGL